MPRTELDVESYCIAAAAPPPAPPGMVDQQMRWNGNVLLLCELIYCLREVRDAMATQKTQLDGIATTLNNIKSATDTSNTSLANIKTAIDTSNTNLVAIKTATEGANTKLGAGINVHLF